MDTGSGRADSAGQRARSIARLIAIVAGVTSAAAVVGMALGDLLLQGSEVLVSAPFRW
ncbi:hypothetical protein BH23CHL8_BH23CHL8_05290 [soil metagenome]